ncbi:hypothetical protein O181_107045 [Austropuccinia psidii MF-1]|uniref:SNF2 N-terminal domain-containing protein n=1 Tax=Austropuccinia psidii MF-1 TaxID=1389203 RepID=A0A9Q3JPS1_9BASI|nr:hypothetical protein [Austropuccinia psidii MF-1]
MSTPSQPLCIGMINICIQINSDIKLNPDNSHLSSWIILWQNQHNIFVYLPNHQRAIGSLPGALSKTLNPFLGAPQTFMHWGPGGAWIENCQSNPTQILFVEGVFITDANDPSLSQKPNLELMFFTCFISCCFIIDFQAKSDTISQWIRPPHDDPAPFHYSNPPPPSSKCRPSFSLGSRNPQWPISRNLWAISPPGSTFNARHIITNKDVSSFESLLTNTPLGGLLVDDMGLGKTIQAIALIGTSKELLIANPHCSTPTMIICPPRLITHWQSEISKHAQDGALQAKIYHGPTSHSLSEANILKYDIIIIS